MTEVIDGFAKRTSSVSFIRCDLGHGKIGLAKDHSLRVDTNEDFCNGFNFKILAEFDQSDLVCQYVLEVFKTPVFCCQ